MLQNGNAMIKLSKRFVAPSKFLDSIYR